MRKLISRVLFAAVPVLHLGLAVAQEAAPAPAAAPKAFAAPGTAASLPTGTAGGIGQATLALVVVLAAIFALAWLARRLRSVARGNDQGIDVIAQAAVGPRERVVIVRIGDTRLLLGVAPGRVSRLHELPADLFLGATARPAAKFPTLTDSFRSLLGKSGKQDGGK